MMKIYLYANCDTCRMARKFLERHGIAFEPVPIVERPPTLGELERMLRTHLKGQRRKLFNVSGQAYRGAKLGEKLDSLSDQEALDLLAANGKLVKRPFLLGRRGGTEIGLVGFDENAWKVALLG